MANPKSLQEISLLLPFLSRQTTPKPKAVIASMKVGSKTLSEEEVKLLAG
ncbi:MAG: hypothetical protein WA865_22285 [Spirulinaceae cyanobacterium]